MNMTVVVPGKPHSKARPRFNHKTNRVWTPSTPHEDAVATQLLRYKGKFKGVRRIALLAWFYGADPRADGDNLWKLLADAAVKAQMIDDDRYIVHGAFTLFDVDAEENPTPGVPCTKMLVGNWDE